MTEQNEKIAGQDYLALLLVTMSTLMLEILLTRIFSVTMWYHFAFMAVSIAMFGMTVGAIAVYLLPGRFPSGRTKAQMAFHALAFSLATVMAFIVHLKVPFRPHLTFAGIVSVAVTFAALAIPFFFSGVVTTLALTRFPGKVGRLYAADLAGAAIGAFLIRFLLGPLNGPTAVILVAALAGMGSWLFSRGTDGLAKVRHLALACVFFFAALVGLNLILARGEASLLPITWVKDMREPELSYEKWSSFARISVWKEKFTTPFGWGISPRWNNPLPVEQLQMYIDFTAATVLTRFDGDIRPLQYLKYDITNLAYYLRPHSSVLVVGTGGGRDVLSALVFGQSRVLGVEINRDIIQAVNRRFGEFTGHLDRQPGVNFVVDEARSYLTRLREKFAVIQMSLIDTFSATAAGAFVLSENSLYTVEAWRVFLDHLTDDGLLTVSRWYTGDLPAEMYRATALAVAALKQAGLANPRQHLLVARVMLPVYQLKIGVGTLLVKKQPLTPAEVAEFQQRCAAFGFDVILTPAQAFDDNFSLVASARNQAQPIPEFALDISPPSDDKPFFFNMLHVRDALRTQLWRHASGMNFNIKAVMTLGVLLLVVVILVLLGVGLPLLLTGRRASFAGSPTFFFYFAGIGLGFMLIEISQMQRLSIFLGHPNYGLTVVLFTLLLASSLGSFLSHNILSREARAAGVSIWAILLGALLLFGLATLPLLNACRDLATPLRIAIAVGLLFVPGIGMGMAFPLGMHWAAQRTPALTSWYWGINGAVSVLASVLAVVISLTWGITVTFWTGFAAYVVALLSFLFFSAPAAIRRRSEAASAAPPIPK